MGNENPSNVLQYILVSWQLIDVMMVYGVWRNFQQYFSYIGGGNRRTRGKPLTCRKSLTNFIT